MPTTPCRIIITPDETVAVTIYTTTSGSVVAPAYTTENGSSAHGFPVTIAAGVRTEFWLPNPGNYSISALYNGTEIAGPSGNRMAVGVMPGGSASVAVGINRPAEDSAVLGTYVPVAAGVPDVRYEGVTRRIDPNLVVARNATAKMAVTTPDASGQVVEPAVYYNPNGWNGHRYWFAITGYTDGDADTENPSIYYSDDGTTLTPVPGAPFPVVPKPAGGNNFDPEIVLGPDNRLYIIFCEIITATNVVSVKCTSSADGVTWTTPVTLWSAVKTVESAVGPIAYWDTAAGQWVIFYTDIQNYWNAVNAPHLWKRRTAPSLTAGAVSAATTCTITGLPASRSPFEAHLARSGGQLQVVLTLCDTMSGGSTANKLHFMVSDDGGLTWTVATNPFLIASAAGWDNGQIYRGDIVPLDDGTTNLFDFWYSAKDGAADWWMGRTTIALAPTAATRTTSDVFVRKTADESVTSSAVLQDDDHIQFEVGPNEVWSFRCVLIYDGGTTGDIGVNFAGPAGATISWGGYGAGTSVASAPNATVINTLGRSTATATNYGAVAVGTKQSIIMEGIIRTGSTPGTVKLQWAQAVSDATATTVYTDSHLKAHLESAA